MTRFTLASALCGLAPTPVALIGFRVLQGGAAAVMSPQVLAIIQVTFALKDRAKAFGAYGAVLGVSGVLGQVLGGLLIRAEVLNLGWRTVFLVNVPVVFHRHTHCNCAFAGIARATRPAARYWWRTNRLGGGALLAYPLVAGRDAGWPWWTWPCLIASAPLLVIFTRFERWQGRRGGSPLWI